MSDGAVDLFWIPLGAGGHSVRLNGRIYELVAARAQRRPRCELYHAALVVTLGAGRFTLEIAPSPDADEVARGVVATGAVGSRLLGGLRLFRYEVRCWRDGVIPDLRLAVARERLVAGDPTIARRVLDSVAKVPTPVWGRDELGTGEMWNSNSMIAWVLSEAGLRVAGLLPPSGGRAPGWNAGVAVSNAPK